jgi:hypothetical protein
MRGDAEQREVWPEIPYPKVENGVSEIIIQRDENNKAKYEQDGIKHA